MTAAADEGAVRLRLVTAGPDGTRGVGVALADLLEPGDVVALSGELGAGKTCLVQGVAVGLGITERVTSPTFVLVRWYEGRLPLVHCDVYRLERLRDVDDLGEDVLAPDVVTCVEWGDAIAALLPDDRIEVELLRGDGDTADDGTRAIEVRGVGPRWQARGDALAAALALWA